MEEARATDVHRPLLSKGIVQVYYLHTVNSVQPAPT